MAKFDNELSLRCGYCELLLSDRHIVFNSHHIFHIGITYVCPCRKSRLWTNSLRNPEAFIRVIDGHFKYEWEKKLGYSQGFCNDRYCGYTGEYVKVLENGYQPPPEKTKLWRTIRELDEGIDRLGNPNHPVNTMIMRFGFQGYAGDKEAAEALIPFYKQHRVEVEKWIRVQERS